MAGGLVSACLYPAKAVPLFQHDGRWSWRDRRISSQLMMISSTTTTRQLMAPVAAHAQPPRTELVVTSSPLLLLQVSRQLLLAAPSDLSHCSGRKPVTMEDGKMAL